MSERHLVGTARDPVSTCKAFVRSVVHGFISCVLSIWNRCLSTALRKLTSSEISLRPQMFLCTPRPGLETETSRTATSHSSHSAPGVSYTYLFLCLFVYISLYKQVCLYWVIYIYIYLYIYIHFLSCSNLHLRPNG